MAVLKIASSGFYYMTPQRGITFVLCFCVFFKHLITMLYDDEQGRAGAREMPASWSQGLHSVGAAAVGNVKAQLAEGAALAPGPCLVLVQTDRPLVRGPEGGGPGAQGPLVSSPGS